MATSKAVAGGLLTTVLLASGCSAGWGAAKPAPVPTPTTVTTAELRLPADAYTLTPEQEAQSAYLGRMLIRACMRRFGFDYPVPANGKPVVLNKMERRYGVSDLAVARVYGYHPALDSVPGQRIAKDYRPSAAERGVLEGSDKRAPAGGCLGEAARGLGDDGAISFTQPPGLVRRIDADSYNRALEDGRVNAAFAAWSNCMKVKGHAYANPIAASTDKRWWLPAGAFGPEVVSRSEIATAEADIACKAKTNVNGIWWAVEAEYQNAAIAEHSGELARIKKALNRRLQKLRELAATYRVQ